MKSVTETAQAGRSPVRPFGEYRLDDAPTGLSGTYRCGCGPARPEPGTPRPAVLWGATVALTAGAVGFSGALALLGRC
ncbi:hypothetical protein [Streptomyces sp. NPDC058657]|uniref:hypothetical protein n=1 Tax=unclassified Streptomyces TaxID=2593676 RepID=UPI00364BC2D3